MEQLRQREQLSNTGGRKRFTSEETDTIKCFFSDYIASKSVPLLRNVGSSLPSIHWAKMPNKSEIRFATLLVVDSSFAGLNTLLVLSLS